MQKKTMQSKNINLNNITTVWLVGIKGTGMTPVAQILCRQGKKVSGSDVTEDFFTKDVLDELPVTIVTDFTAKNITDDIDLVIYSTAYKSDHVEIKAAEKKHIPVLSLPEMHELLMRDKKSIAVAGTHGKTTTTALLGYILQQADIDPTVLVGAPVPQFTGSALVGGSDFFVLEACEYAHKFQHYSPMVLLLTNIEYDHPDVFSSREAYSEEYAQLIQRIPQFGFVVANVDDVNVQKVMTKTTAELLTFGSVPSASWRIERDEQYTGTAAQGFSIVHDGNLWAKGETNLVGHFNLLNILGAVVTAQQFGVGQDIILRAVKRFRSPKRRFEYKGTTAHGAQILDDFAHHPTEIQVTLRALREQYPNKSITVVFQPHTFSRTQALLGDFAHSFKDADHVYILDIYGSAREQEGGVTTEDVVNAIAAVSHNSTHTPDHKAALAALAGIHEQDIVITMGATDVWKIGDELTHTTHANPGKPSAC